MRLGDLLDKAGIKYPAEVENIYVKNIVTDSRQVSRDSMFVCIKGLANDGHEHIGEALKRGASAIVAERVRDECVGGAAAYITHDNTRKASALLYNAFFDSPVDKLKIVGVTGTNGKTSVSTMLYHIFREAGYRTGLMGTVCRLKADGRALSSKKGLTTANMTTPDPDELYRACDELGGKSVAETLLTPTKIYVKSVLALLEKVNVRGISHITGGGFYENIPRSIPAGLGAKINGGAIRVLPIFELIAKRGNIPERDMYNTYNMGVGMSITVPADEVETALEILRANGETAYVIGEIVSAESLGGSQIEIV